MNLSIPTHLSKPTNLNHIGFVLQGLVRHVVKEVYSSHDGQGTFLYTYDNGKVWYSFTFTYDDSKIHIVGLEEKMYSLLARYVITNGNTSVRHLIFPNHIAYEYIWTQNGSGLYVFDEQILNVMEQPFRSVTVDGEEIYYIKWQILLQGDDLFSSRQSLRHWLITKQEARKLCQESLEFVVCQDVLFMILEYMSKF